MSSARFSRDWWKGFRPIGTSIVPPMAKVQVERADGVVTITLSNPGKKNAMTMEAWETLRDEAHGIAEHTQEDRCVVLTGADGDFCSGQDLWAGSGGEPVHQLTRMRLINACVQSFHDLPQPTIAKVDGVAVGIGLNLALSCDFVLATDRARFSEIFAKRGLSLDGGGSWLLPRLVGLQRAKELALFAEIIPAADAHAMGLVNRVVPVDDLDALVDEWAARLVALPPVALAMTKKMLNRSFEQGFEQALDDEARSQTVNGGTRDTAEALQAFVEKRTPTFRGF
jgi:enoyl-CoA hydratase/carnithine racemase